MDANWPFQIVNGVLDELWVDKVNETFGTGRFCQWVSTLHPNKLPCRLDGGTFHHGGFNAGLKMVFNDNSVWMVRFPRAEKVSAKHADEKVAMEVAALNLIRDHIVRVKKKKVKGNI